MLEALHYYSGVFLGISFIELYFQNKVTHASCPPLANFTMWASPVINQGPTENPSLDMEVIDTTEPPRAQILSNS